MTVKFRIENLAIDTVEGSVDYSFNSDLTVLAGPSGVGKTTLLELIKWGLGGDGQLAPVITEKAHEISLEITIGDEKLRLIRSIDPAKRKNVRVIDLTTQERLPDHRTGAGEPSLNSLLMTSLGLPTDMRAAAQTGRSTKAGSRVTFADIFTYLYIPQAEMNRDIARSQDKYIEPKRKVVFELLFGLTDSELLARRSEANVLKGRVEEAVDHHAKILQFLDDSNTQSRVDAETALAEAQSAQRQAEAQRAQIRDDLDPVTDRETQALRDLLNEAERNLADAKASEVTFVRQRQDLVSELRRVEGDLSRLGRMRDAGERLAQIEFTTCPRCVQSLNNREVPPGHCRLCMLPDETQTTSDFDQYEVLQLKDQLDEMQKQIHFVGDQIAQVRKLVQDREELLRQLGTTIDARTSERISPRLQVFADVTERIAASRTAQEHYENILMQWDRVTDLAQAEDELKREYASLMRKIESDEAKIDERRKYLVDEISREFNRVVSVLGIPGVEEASIHPTNYLPLLNGKPFRLMSRGGGIVTATQVAYWTSLVAVALRERNTFYPSFLMLDSPRLALNTDDELTSGLYRRLVALAEANRAKLQFIIADNELPASYRKDYAEIDFDFKRPTVRTVRHPGKNAVKPLTAA